MSWRVVLLTSETWEVFSKLPCLHKGSMKLAICDLHVRQSAAILKLIGQYSPNCVMDRPQLAIRTPMVSMSGFMLS